MKKLLYITLIALSYSCSGFLDEVSQDKLVPEKTDHFAALLLQEFNSDYSIFRNVDYMTDNLTEKPSAYTLNKKSNKTIYTWQREIEIDEDGNVNYFANQAWEYAYKDIAVANYVIELIDNATGTQQEIEQVKGEAYFIRAFSYFNLLNLYGQPFQASSANIDLGVPLRTNVGIESTYSRNNVQECYQQIELDLKEAANLIKTSGLQKSIFHPTTDACNLLLSRAYLYQEKWDDVIISATEVITNHSLEIMSGDHLFITTTNPEILFSYHTTNPLFAVLNSSGSAEARYYKVSKDLINLYQPEDNRLKCYFIVNDDDEGKTYQPLKYTKDYYTQLGYNNFRVAEAYLNRAEAYAWKGENQKAMDDLKELVKHRFTDPAVVTFPETNSDLLQFIQDERRRELCFEDHHRWFDLRRMKNRPVIKHTFTLVGIDGVKSATETYTLLSNDPNYALPIPLKERENNALIRNNDRYEKIPVVEFDTSF